MYRKNLSVDFRVKIPLTLYIVSRKGRQVAVLRVSLAVDTIVRRL